MGFYYGLNCSLGTDVNLTVIMLKGYRTDSFLVREEQVVRSFN